MPTDLRSALEEAYRKADGGEKVEPETEAIDEAGVAEDSEPRESEAASEETGDREHPSSQSTDESESEEPTSAESKPSTSDPVAWRAAARQHWGELPEEVQQEVLRREKEIGEGLRDSSEARQFKQQFEEMVAPYRPFMAAEGVDPMQATRNLMQTAAVLQVGNPHQKADMVARIIQQYGVDIATLDSLLSGQGAPQQRDNGAGAAAPLDPRLTQYLDQRLAPMTQFMTGLQQAQGVRQQQTEQQVEAEIEAFASDPANFLFNDVQDTMANLIEVSKMQGQSMNLKQAYDAAVAMNPELAKLAAQRQASMTARQGNATLQRKKLAAKSIQGVPQQATTEAPTDLRGALEAAWDQMEGGSH